MGSKKNRLGMYLSLVFSPLAWKKHVYVFRPAMVDISGEAIIRVKKKFVVNKQWSASRQRRNKLPAILYVKKGAILNVDSFVCHAGCKVSVHEGAELTLHSGFLNNEAVINCTDHISIGKNCAISERVVIRDSNGHKMKYDGYSPSAPIEIGDHVWIGMNAIILPGVKIGDGAVIAAGAVVSRDIPSRTLAAGVPARVIRENVDWE